jgi:hypothetical protein
VVTRDRAPNVYGTGTPAALKLMAPVPNRLRIEVATGTLTTPRLGAVVFSSVMTPVDWR